MKVEIDVRCRREIQIETIVPGHSKYDLEILISGRLFLEIRVKVGQKLGTGSFGTVYQGLYKHDDDGEIPCAIKEAKNDALREQLLNEAFLMK